MHRFSVSVVIPTYNRIDYLKYCIASLAQQNYSKELMEIIVVDNDSTDGTMEWLQTQDHRINVHYERVPKLDIFEAAKLRNIGVNKAKGEIIIFIDSDIIVPPDFVTSHLAFYQNPSEMACVIGRVIYLKDIPIQLSDLNNLDTLLGRAFNFVDPLESDIMYCNENLTTHPIPWALCHSGNLSSTRYCINYCRGFDEWHRRWSVEDLDFGYALFKKNVRFFFCNNAYGLHKYHPVYNNNEKSSSTKEGYKYMISKNPGVIAFEHTIKLLLDELEMSNQGFVLTERYRREKYKYLKALYFPDYVLPEVTVAMYVIHRDRDRMIANLKELEDQYNTEKPFEVIIINGDSSFEIEKQIQFLCNSYDLRLFNLQWEKEIRELLIDSLKIKQEKINIDQLDGLEKKLLLDLEKSNEFGSQHLGSKFEKYVYPRAFGRFIKYVTHDTVIGPNFIQNVWVELRLD